LISLYNVNDQTITFHFNLEGVDIAGRRSVNLFAVIGIGGLANAAALDRACAGNGIKTAMADMCTSIVKGMKFSVVATDYQYAHGQIVAFQSQSAAWLLKFRCALQVDYDFAVLEGPALRIERFGSRRKAENALKETAIQEFDGHEASKEPVLKRGYFGKGLNSDFRAGTHEAQPRPLSR
jgi:hypothetical protein